MTKTRRTKGEVSTVPHTPPTGQPEQPEQAGRPAEPRQPDQPGYRRLAQHLRQGITEERWAEGEPLPTDLELGAEFDVSRQTVRRAYLELVHDGLVFRVPGRGTFITPSHLRYGRPFETVDDLLGLSDDTEMELLVPLAGGWDQAAAARLGLTTRLLYVMQFTRSHRDAVFCHTTVHLPPDIGRRVEDLDAFTHPGQRSEVTVIGTLAERGVVISGAEQSMTARAATPSDAEILGCEVGHPLLHVERLYVDEEGVPVEFAVSSFLPEHYTHRLHLGRRPATSSRPD